MGQLCPLQLSALSSNLDNLDYTQVLRHSYNHFNTSWYAEALALHQMQCPLGTQLSALRGVGRLFSDC
jgi:hypothetical protein